ncbi:MAG: hypothetical protein NT145_03755 [Elusimicrobia bacterium]|nr:hypothetical protein [Elusimicrobiota bacterium]
MKQNVFQTYKTLIDQKLIDELTLRFGRHEDWINSGCETNKRPENPIKEYFLLGKQNTKAYNYYRHKLYYFIRWARNSSKYIDEISDLFKIAKKNAIEMEKLASFVKTEDIHRKFKNQFHNSIEIFDENISKIINHKIIYFYQQKYEIEFVLIFLFQLINIIMKGSYDSDLNKFRDTKGKLIKGKIIENIISGTKSFPEIKKIIEKAYNKDLRNTIGHNEYRLKNECVYSMDGKITISKDKFMESLFVLQEIQNAVLWLIFTYFDEDDLNETKKCGIVSIGYSPNGMSPKIYLFQLWPFFEISDASWIEEVSINVEKERMETKIWDGSIFTGEYDKDMREWVETATKNKNNVEISLIAVLPNIFLGENLMQTPEWGEFFITNDILTRHINISIN